MQQVLLRENKLRRNQEHFWVIGLDNGHKILFIELVALGQVNRVNANPPDVFRMAIYKLAVHMILVHNHPSGDLKPSEQDCHFTDRILKVGKLINIDVIDHIIISEESFTSLDDTGVMEKLANSGLFEIVEREKQELTEWKRELELKHAIKDRNMEIGKKMKKDGLDEDTIKKYSGLTKLEIRRL